MSLVPRPRPRSWISAAAAVLVLAGCSTEEPDIEVATSPEPTTSVTASGASKPDSTSTRKPAEPSASTAEKASTAFITIGPDSVTPIAEQLDLAVDAPLILDITSSRAAELHVHSSPEQEIEVKPGHKTVELTFDKPGTVDVEEHESGSLILRVLVH